jgi:hypothetical protein
MFCDLAGSTALPERQDPEKLRELMRSVAVALSLFAWTATAHAEGGRAMPLRPKPDCRSRQFEVSY